MPPQSRSFTRRTVAILVAALGIAGCGGKDETAARPLTIYTHCGVWSATVDGQLWLAAPPLHDGSHNPLPGWDANDTPGTWRDLGNGRAEFRADSGEVAQFVAAEPGQEDPNAGCE